MLDWIDPNHFELHGERFTTVSLDEVGTGADGLLVVKERGLLDACATFFGRHPGARIVELGIYQGGSTAMLALLSDPSHLLAVDLSPGPLPALDRFLVERGLTDRVHTRFGVDQRDVSTLEALVADTMGNAPLDIVIDDASHDFGPTVTSFEILFPKLRPGGWYLIEDWNWAERYAAAGPATIAETLGTEQAEVIRQKLEQVRRGVPLHRMAVELALARASMDEAIGRVTITPWWIMVERGPKELAASFRYDDLLVDDFDQLSPRRS